MSIALNSTSQICSHYLPEELIQEWNKEVSVFRGFCSTSLSVNNRNHIYSLEFSQFWENYFWRKADRCLVADPISIVNHVCKWNRLNQIIFFNFNFAPREAISVIDGIDFIVFQENIARLETS